jgi:hypothetical protein
VLSEFTLRAVGMYRPEVTYPTLADDDRAWLPVRDPAARERQKEQRRKRRRSRIKRDSDPPRVNPLMYRPEQRWAADVVNLIAAKRYAPSEGRLTAWLTDFPPATRSLACWIFRHVARRGGGSGLGKKFNARTISDALLAPVFPANMQIDGDAPTPLFEGQEALAALVEQLRHLPAESRSND